MGLIICKDCGKEISDQALQCLNCGCPTPRKQQMEFEAERQLLEEDAYAQLRMIQNDERNKLAERLRCLKGPVINLRRNPTGLPMG